MILKDRLQQEKELQFFVWYKFNTVCIQVLQNPFLPEYVQYGIPLWKPFMDNKYLCMNIYHYDHLIKHNIISNDVQ